MECWYCPKPLALLGRDEMNLAEFPITLLTDRVPKDQKEAVYQDELYDDRTGLALFDDCGGVRQGISNEEAA